VFAKTRLKLFLLLMKHIKTFVTNKMKVELLETMEINPQVLLHFQPVLLDSLTTNNLFMLRLVFISYYYMYDY